MSILAVLARQALGQPGGIRPHLAGRFEDVAAGDAFEEVPATATAVGQPPVAIAPATAPAAARSLMPASPRPSSAPSPRPVQTMPAVAGPVVQRKAATARAVDAARPGDAVRQAPRSQAPLPADMPRAAPPMPGAAVQPATPAPPPAPERLVTNDPVRRPQPFTPLLPDLAVTATPAQPTPSIPASRSNDVTVTIGRIEVRAATPPRRAAAPARPRPPSRTMSLEDYLGGRSR